MLARRHRLLANWMAILAVLLNALAPALSQAVAAERAGVDAAGRAWVEVCSAQGSTWLRLEALEQLALADEDAPSHSTPQAHGQACGYCLTHAGSFGLPPLPVNPVPMPAQVGLATLLDEGLVQAVKMAWAAPSARAPPV